MLVETLLVLSLGTEEIETPRGGVDAGLERATLTFSTPSGVVAGAETMNLSPDIGREYTESSFVAGYTWKGFTYTYGTKNNSSYSFQYGWKETGLFLNLGVTDRERSTRKTATVGKMFGNHFGVGFSYGESDYSNGLNGTFSALTLITKF